MINFLMNGPIDFMAMTEVFNKISNGAHQGITGFTSIVGPIALLVAILCGIMLFFGGDHLNMIGKRWLERIIAGAGVVLLAKPFLEWLNSIFGGSLKF